MRVGRPLVALGAFDAEARECLHACARDLGLALISDESGALPELGGRSPLAVVVPLGTSWVNNACLRVRMHSGLAHVPVLGLVNHPTDMHFGELFACGGDDVVSYATAPLRARLKALSRGQRADSTPPPAGRKGLAIVASASSDWRVLMGRALVHGGYSVEFALEPAAVARPEARLVVVDEAMLNAGARAALAERASAETQSWVIVGDASRVGALRRELGHAQRVAVVPATPAENVLFVATELTYDAASRRASPRLLYGTPVAFRLAGSEHDELGFTYNVSASGVYVRTLAPLPVDRDAWLELRPPRDERRVRLVGRVVWRRLFEEIDGASVPPGFGVELRAGLEADLALFRAGYDALGNV